MAGRNARLGGVFKAEFASYPCLLLFVLSVRGGCFPKVALLTQLSYIPDRMGWK